MSNHTDKIRPYCQTAIAAANTTYFCSKCQIPHHAKCWQDNDGCTTINHITRNHPRGFCTSCGNPSWANARFCSHCGEALTNPLLHTPISKIIPIITSKVTPMHLNKDTGLQPRSMQGFGIEWELH